jgi:predicted nucleic acid-binding protein
MSYLIDTNIISEVRRGARCDPHVSAWYAATALTNGLTLVTRNDRDVAGLGATVFNPFKGAENDH